VQKWGDNNVQEIHPGNVIWFPPNEKHWHGATATTVMTHIAIQEQIDGKTTDWMKKVTESLSKGF
jgi:quercetin dioxygenase-like cupin family protein